VIERLAQIRAGLGRTEALLVTNSVNVAWLCAATGLIDAEDPHLMLITPTEALLFTDSRYFDAARAQRGDRGSGTVSHFVSKCDTVPDPLSPPAADWEVALLAAPAAQVARLIDCLRERSLTSVELEDSIRYRRYRELNERFKEAGIAVTTGRGRTEKLRRHKDAGEIQAIAAAQAITDAAFTEMLDLMEVGMSEIEIAAELEYRMRRLGATGLAFPSIIAAGENGARPHAVPSQRPVAGGDLLVMDFGAELDGYCSDMTRTVAFGDPGAEAREVYAVVLAAQEAALNAARAGLPGADLDAAAREVITEAGYGACFGHGLSHGVGLQIHEAPHASPHSRDTLEVGDVISVEPGIYLPGRFGVRIEDLIAITTDGIRNFTASPKELITL